MKYLPWLAALLAGVLVYGIGRFDGRGSLEDAALDRQTAAALHAHAGWAKQLVAVQTSSTHTDTVLVQLGKKEAVAIAGADDDARLIDSLKRALPPLAGDSTAYWHHLFEVRTLEADDLRVALAASTARADSAIVDRDHWKELTEGADRMSASLARALSDEHDARDCRIGPRFLSVPCPSRKMAMLLGAGSGIVLGVVLTGRK